VITKKCYNINMLTLKYFFLDFFGSLLRWPVWWYSSGLVYVVKQLVLGIQGYAKSLAVGVWIKNLFVPMFGQNDWQSRLISFGMRVFQIIARSIFVMLWSVLMMIVFLIYIILPIFAVTGLIYQIFGLLLGV